MPDILVIGGGVSGTAVARALSRYKLQIALLTNMLGHEVGAETDAQRAGLHRVGRAEMLEYVKAIDNSK
jgi:glycine/D-amino acid oxidase-like deaminating enzyme